MWFTPCVTLVLKPSPLAGRDFLPCTLNKVQFHMLHGGLLRSLGIWNYSKPPKVYPGAMNQKKREGWQLDTCMLSPTALGAVIANTR